MRTRATCLAEGKAFLQELITHESATGQPKCRCQASEQTRTWCKSHRYAEVVGPHTRGANHKKNGWIVTALGRRKITEGLPL